MDDPYRDSDLVVLYDVDNPDGEDHACYRALADGLAARRIVDLGCGTGLLTRSFVRADRSVTGIDPSATMIDFARAQPGAGAVAWVLGDASALAASRDVDLVVCTGNAIMHLAPAEFSDALARVAAALRPGGVFAFETRNPAARAWESWTRERTYGERDTPLGWLREWIEVTSVEVTGVEMTGAEVTGVQVTGMAAGRVEFDAHNRLTSGEDRVYTSVLYFRDRATVVTELERAGFGSIEVTGGWHDEPFTDAARFLLVRATRSD